MIKRVVLALVATLFFVPSVQAYSPPPGGVLRVFIPNLKIELPPRLIMTPDRLMFPQSDKVYAFDTNSGQFQPTNGLYLKHRVATELKSAGNDGAYYVITIFGFTKDELPEIKDFRLTFKPTVSRDAIDRVETFLNGNSVPTARITGPSCQGSEQSHICLTTTTTVRVPIVHIPVAKLHQTIPIKGVFVQGNVAAPGAVENFRFDSPHAIAVGGSIDVKGGAKVLDYVNQQTTIFGWNNVSTQIDQMYNRGASIGTTVNSPGNFDGSHYTGSSWNLNSTAQNPADNFSNSFSALPEGKIWYVNNDLVLDSATSFAGAGTIVVNGNLTINDTLSCEAAGKTRLAFLVKSGVTINTSDIGCGAYIAKDEGIVLANSPKGEVRGIFIAHQSITLPDPNQLTSAYFIRYDSYLAAHPTALIQELLQFVLSAS